MRIIPQKISKNVKRYRASKKDVRWHQDPKGYFLLRLGKDKKNIEVAFCTNNHVIIRIFSGNHPVQLYYKISQTIKGLRPEHYSYLGKELHRAWLCMKQKKKYVQDDETQIRK